MYCVKYVQDVSFVFKVFLNAVFVMAFSMLNFIQQRVPDVVGIYPWYLGLVPDVCSGWARDGPSICNKILKIF